VVRFWPSEQSEDGFVDFVLARSTRMRPARSRKRGSTGRANGGAVRARRSSAASRAITPSCSPWRCTRSTPCALPPYNAASSSPSRHDPQPRPALPAGGDSPGSTLSMKARLVAHSGPPSTASGLLERSAMRNPGSWETQGGAVSAAVRGGIWGQVLGTGSGLLRESQGPSREACACPTK
jgi:hypothetical protein